MPEACRWGFLTEVVKCTQVAERLLTFSLCRVLKLERYEPEGSLPTPDAVVKHESFGMVAGS